MNFSNQTPEYFAPTITIQEIKARVTIFDLWRKLELPGDPKTRRIRSPFREDKTPSFGIFGDGRHWKDFGSATSGDVIDFWQAATGVDRSQAIKDLRSYCGQPEIISRKRLPVYIPPQEPDLIPRHIMEMKDSAVRHLRSSMTNGNMDRFLSSKHFDLNVLRKLPIGSFPPNTVWESESKSISLYGKIAYAYPHGLKCRSKFETSHYDFWIWGKAIFNVWRGDHLLDESIHTIVVFEGETDLIAAIHAYPEPAGVLYISIPGASWSPLPSMSSLIGSHRRVILALDDDDAGREATARLFITLAAIASYCEVENFPWELLRDGLSDKPDIGEAWIKNPTGLSKAFSNLKLESNG